jgi:hypothetical protein
MIAVLLDEEEAVAKKKKCNKWKETNFGSLFMGKKTNIDGEFATLYNERVDHETKFCEHFRMSQYSFKILLLKIQYTYRRHVSSVSVSVPKTLFLTDINSRIRTRRIRTVHVRIDLYSVSRVFN